MPIIAFLVILVGPEWPKFQDEGHELDAIVGQRHFDFLVWEVRALAAKGEALLTSGHKYLTEETRKQLVLDYLQQLGQVRRLEAEISTIYADPAIEDPDSATRELQVQVDGLRSELTRIQPVAEPILQEQVAFVLAEEGFDLLGQAWPPVEMHMTPLPYILIVSPREEIRQIHNIPLEHGLSIPEQEEIESAVYDTVDRSALVVPVGGIGFFPAMIVESGSINFLADVIAHEWSHHWLALHPLGLNYAASPTLRTMNETVAKIVGKEIGALVVERFYPEFAPSEDQPPSDEPPSDQDDQPGFDFEAEMAKTRNKVDELLAEGRVEEAEGYMETQRQIFWENGYKLRKLNQAYFAFYGAYADTPGQQGDDPIGPALVALREESSSLREFMDRVAKITSVEELREATGNLETSPEKF